MPACAGGTAADAAVVIERAKLSEVAPLIVDADGLTPREVQVTRARRQMFAGHYHDGLAEAVHGAVGGFTRAPALPRRSAAAHDRERTTETGYRHGMAEQDRALFLVVTIKPRLDRLEEAEAQLQSMRRNSLNEPGCVFMHLTQPQDEPDTWVMLEMFRSRAAWDDHMRQPYNTEGNKILEDLLREPSDLRLLDEK